MNITSRYKLSHFIPWTRRKIYLMLALSIIPTALFYFLGWSWLAIPWVPVALLGTATAFISGFRNTQTYNRSWEARTLYEWIKIDSQTFGKIVRNFIRSDNLPEEKELQKEVIYRHFAWLTALRFQLRETKPWENIKTKAYNREYLQHYKIPEWESNLEEELKPFLPETEIREIAATNNRATQILFLQSKRLRELHLNGFISAGNYGTLEGKLDSLMAHQGHCERIKNFPYPRQFTSINLYFTNLFCFFLPFGFIGAFSPLIKDHGPLIVWLAIPMSVVIGWVFLVLEQIGESTENPFEGNANDVPVTQISRDIEINLREMLNEKELPPKIEPKNNILM